MNRLGFLKALGIGASGLILGEEALEAFARLTWRRTIFPGAEVYGAPYVGTVQSLQEIYNKVQGRLMDAIQLQTPESEWFAKFEPIREGGYEALSFPLEYSGQIVTRPFSLSRA